MSLIEARVISIDSCESLHIVKFVSNSHTLSMMSLDIDDTIDIDSKVALSIKPSHITIAKRDIGEISHSNQLPCIIESIENGKLLTSITLSFLGNILESIITQESSKRMNLQKGDEVIALIKASDIFISEIYND